MTIRRDSYRNPNGVREQSDSGYGLGTGLRPSKNASSRAREERLEWARQHFPDFGDRLVLHAIYMAERRPGADGYTVETVTAELDRMHAEPLRERPAES